MEALLSPKALMLIEESLKPIIEAKRNIERIKMVVSPESKIAACSMVKTAYGRLRIEKDNHVPQGVSYLIEDPGLPNRAFSWVTRQETEVVNGPAAKEKSA